VLCLETTVIDLIRMSAIERLLRIIATRCHYALHTDDGSTDQDTFSVLVGQICCVSALQNKDESQSLFMRG
jgi:hypothetical protein